MNKAEVFFNHSNKAIRVEKGTLLSDACSMAGYPLDLVCGGKGTCGKCKVTIRCNGKKEEVLSCITKVEKDVTVYLNPEDIKKDAAILTNGGEKFNFNPSIGKKYIRKTDIPLNHCGYYWEYFKKELNLEIDYNTTKTLERVINNNNVDGFTIVYDKSKLIDVQENDQSHLLYGAAIDIGTTSVVMYLYDMCTGKLIGTYSDLNQQISRGADVISRIMHCTSNEDGIDELQRKIIQTINGLLDRAEKDYPHLPYNLYQTIICGNSTMQHLFHGFNPSNLGMSPFVSIYKDEIKSRGTELGIQGPASNHITFLPLLGGFVGADTTAVLTALKDDPKIKLVVDLGTNGEIGIGNNDRYIVASTACGPALEGAGLEYGMRGTTGAIERFEILDGKALYSVIGNTKAKGICGSGIVDIVAELFKFGFINASGKMLSQEEFDKLRPNCSLTHRICNHNGITAFQLVLPEDSVNGDGVFVTQKDIRQIQLAKSAIYTGCVMLIEKYGITENNLDEILLAGAFGNYINIKNAESIGLLPYFENVTAKSIGNAAGTGVQMYLLDEDVSSTCREIVSNTTHLELASDPEFQNNYIMSMGF
ncbi:Uncharacterized 2Fe-2 and 4Fe-4S clusters-containing protein, contains DUF4445 domain [Dethiosulfatibacter aminovorans DSM 17477]|uniref:Uncharacterized 2Fe-2 and 4Fe-4S clusters-containing protein, contains DUF4445 domain n=1 Tax=Dethiosulfatibacter aminovorans DSM 17477 TaxID=1121476 RepID=A0A1M6J776_9FIRM|nr:ASKHA domain-containing protein [Dethiosulfatibacter aminovorans]SHJ42573.1 Uncharacterized 2Fe-2 and 4Fe-4S clusters-containing protein, contains DUF4445 domain [Dethiosulfatibacter aminovorans DSM 17477]